MTPSTWEPGSCARCDKALDPTVPASLYCSEFCQEYATTLRYFRRCFRDGRSEDPDVREMLQIRMAFVVSGGYDKRSRSLPRELRQAVLSANEGRCCTCNTNPATEVDHISGSSNDRANLQGLCDGCHNRKTRNSMTLMDDAAKGRRDKFFALVDAEAPDRECFDENGWNRLWPDYLRQTREWREGALGVIESGYFGDGSTGTIEDEEHGYYLQQLADRDN